MFLHPNLLGKRGFFLNQGSLSRSAHVCSAVAVLGFFLLAAGCNDINATPATPAAVQALKAAALAPPRLQPGEKIRVVIYGEPSLSGDFVIDPSGFVSFPLVGATKAAGLTQHEFEEKLANVLMAGKYLTSPKVTAEITEFTPFYILGEVEKPGAYPYMSGLNVLSAIALAGGTTYRASRSIVLIQHGGEAEMHQYDLTSPIPILPGDIIQIPRRYL